MHCWRASFFCAPAALLRPSRSTAADCVAGGRACLDFCKASVRLCRVASWLLAIKPRIDASGYRIMTHLLSKRTRRRAS